MAKQEGWGLDGVHPSSLTRHLASPKVLGGIGQSRLGMVTLKSLLAAPNHNRWQLLFPNSCLATQDILEWPCRHGKWICLCCVLHSAMCSQ